MRIRKIIPVILIVAVAGIALAACMNTGNNTQPTPEPTADYAPNGTGAGSAQNGNGGAPRQMFTVICDGCGCETQVPFQPRGDRPVYCRECFEAQRQNRF